VTVHDTWHSSTIWQRKVRKTAWKTWQVPWNKKTESEITISFQLSSYNPTLHSEIHQCITSSTALFANIFTEIVPVSTCHYILQIAKLYEIKRALLRSNTVYPLRINWHFRRQCCFHVQGDRLNQARNQHEHGSKQSSEVYSRRQNTSYSLLREPQILLVWNYILSEEDMHVALPILQTLKKILQSSCDTVDTGMVVFPVWWHICMATA
jgi:hypothetical protein